MSAEVFVSTARSLVNQKVRWRHRGRTALALDCVGLIIYSLSFCDPATIKNGERGRADYFGYGREPWENRIRTVLEERYGAPVTDWRMGDIATIRLTAQEPSHVGIIGNYFIDGEVSLIHSHNLYGVVEHRIDRSKSRIMEVYRPWLA